MQFYVYTNTHNTGTAKQIRRRTLAFGDIGRHNSVVVERVGAEWHVHDTIPHHLSHLHAHADAVAVQMRHKPA
jgi:hypothetical protein